MGDKETIGTPIRIPLLDVIQAHPGVATGAQSRRICEGEGEVGGRGRGGRNVWVREEGE